MLLTRAGVGLSMMAALAPWMLSPAHQASVAVATPPRIGYLGLRPMSEQVGTPCRPQGRAPRPRLHRRQALCVGGSSRRQHPFEIPGTHS